MSIFANSSVVEFTYNGFTFDPDYTVTAGLSIRPVLDKAGRTVSHNEYTISVVSWVGRPGAAAGVMDALIIDMRRRLTKTGGALVYKGRGVGDLYLNSTSVKDVAWGPIPGELKIGAINAAKQVVRVEWSVTVRMPDCRDAKFAFAAMEFSYTCSFQLRKNGRVDRTVAGTLRIPNNRKFPASRQLLDSPDAYREKIASPLPKNFHREWAPWVIDEAKTTLAFGWRDVEFDGPCYPEGVVEASASQRTRSDGAGLVVYTTTISGEYELAAGVPYKAGQKAFMELIRFRVREAKRREANNDAGTLQFIPLAYEVTEPNLYGPVRFQASMTFKVVGSKFQKVVAHTGMWLPVESDWNRWAYSLKDSALAPYGYSQLWLKPAEDTLVDLCGVGQTTVPAPGRVEDADDVFAPKIDPALSWLSWKCSVRVESDGGTAEMRTLPQQEVKAPPPSTLEVEMRGGGALGVNPPGGGFAQFQQAGPDAGFGPVGGGTFGNASQPDKPGEVQRRALPACYVYLTGSALRAGYQIPAPQLTAIVGKDGRKIVPVLCNRLDRGEGFVTGVVHNAGVPIYGARWNLRYFLPETPKGGIPAPRNPMLEDPDAIPPGGAGPAPPRER